MSALLEITGLRVERDSGVLLDIDQLSVEAGELAVIEGPTDSGKSLLAAVLSGRVGDVDGAITLDGRRLAGSPSARRRAGLAATVADGDRIAGCSVGEALRIAGGQALERFPALAARASLPAELLSGGEQQLLQVACAWAAAPRLLVLDAPTSGLAADLVAEVQHLVTETVSGGSAVLWLCQRQSDAPAAASSRLDGGVLTTVAPATR